MSSTNNKVIKVSKKMIEDKLKSKEDLYKILHKLCEYSIYYF
jgi:hypothetical protein